MVTFFNSPMNLGQAKLTASHFRIIPYPRRSTKDFANSRTKSARWVSAYDVGIGIRHSGAFSDIRSL